jgi:hypothetical protein
LAKIIFEKFIFHLTTCKNNILTYFSRLEQKVRDPFSSWSFIVFFAYGVFLLWFLFVTVHDRREAEFVKRMDSRWPKILQVWIDHGYFKHGGMAFMEPVDQKPDQNVWRSNSMLFMQLGHLLERLHVSYKGTFSYSLMAIHNQLMTMFSACLLGFLAMRLTFRAGTPYMQAIILGVSAQTVYQTFPFNLDFFWGTVPPTFTPIFLLGFLILEEGSLCSKYYLKRSVYRAVLVFLMGINDPAATFFFFLSYFLIKIITCPSSKDFWGKMVINFLSYLASIGVVLYQLSWVKSTYPLIKFQGSVILNRTGFDGDLTYYYDHMDLLSNRYLLNLPGWQVLLFLGILAIFAVIAIIQRKSKSLNQQTVLLSLSGLYILYAFLLSQVSVIHIYIYDNFLAIPVILALFALLPAWFEIIFSRMKHTFVALSLIMALGVAGLQILAYWIQMPPLFFV